MNKISNVAVLACSAVLLVNCSAASTSTPTASPSRPARTVSVAVVSSSTIRQAIIVGRFVQGGGQAPGTASDPIAGAVSAYTNAAGTGAAASSSSADATGHFSLHLAPGVYYLFGIDPNVSGPGPDGGHRVSYGEAIRAVAGTSRWVDFEVFVP
jgi:hypothetical protein